MKTGKTHGTLTHQRSRDRRSPLWAVTISRECDSLVSRMVIACILEHSGAKTHSVENLHEEKQIRVFGVYLMRASQSYLGQIPQDKLCTLGFKLPFPFYFFQYKSNTASLGFCSIWMFMFCKVTSPPFTLPILQHPFSLLVCSSEYFIVILQNREQNQCPTACFFHFMSCRYLSRDVNVKFILFNFIVWKNETIIIYLISSVLMEIQVFPIFHNYKPCCKVH